MYESERQTNINYNNRRNDRLRVTKDIEQSIEDQVRHFQVTELIINKVWAR